MCMQLVQLLYSFLMMANTSLLRVWDCSSLSNLSNYIIFQSRCGISSYSSSDLYEKHNGLGYLFNVTMATINFYNKHCEIRVVLNGISKIQNSYQQKYWELSILEYFQQQI